MGRLTTLLTIYSDYRTPDRLAEATERDFPVVFSVRLRVSRALRRTGEFIAKNSSGDKTVSAIF